MFNGAFSPDDKFPVGVGVGVGIGRGNAHAGEILQGIFRFKGARVVGAVAQPFPEQGSYAVFVHDANATKVTVVSACDPDACLRKSKEVAERLLRRLKKAGGGTVVLTSTFLKDNVPNGAVGWGVGSSTNDCNAVTEAVGNAFGVTFAPADSFAFVQSAEGASDASVYRDYAVLAATRRGKILFELGGYLPRTRAVTFCTDYQGLDTLSQTPWSNPDAFDEACLAKYRVLLRRLQHAIQARDVAEMAAVATCSAQMRNALLPAARWDEVERIAAQVGALGISVAHSGTVASLLFAPDDHDGAARAAAIVAKEFGVVWVYEFGGGPHAEL